MSYLLTATLNADLNLRGEALGKLAVGGKIDVLHADIGIPKRMPVQVPVLLFALPVNHLRHHPRRRWRSASI